MPYSSHVWHAPVFDLVHWFIPKIHPPKLKMEPESALIITRNGKHTKKLWKDPPFLMGKSTISMGHFQ